MTRRPNAWARRAVQRATLPNAKRPRRLPEAGAEPAKDRSRLIPFALARHARHRGGAPPTSSSSIIAWSATSSMKTSGTLVTTMPALVAASMSTMSTPTLPTPITTQFFRASITCRSMRKPQEVMIASTSETPAANSAGVSARISTMSATGARPSSSRPSAPRPSGSGPVAELDADLLLGHGSPSPAARPNRCSAGDDADAPQRPEARIVRPRTGSG